LNEQEGTLDLKKLLQVFTEHWIPIIAAAVVAAGIGFSLAKFVIPKRYTSEALMYVENSASKRDDSSININDINAAQKLVNTCQILFTSNYVFDDLNAHFGNIYTNEQLKKMIKIESVNSTEVLRVSVETGDPQESWNVANELVSLASDEFQRIIKGGSIETVSPPVFPQKHTFPNALYFTAGGAVIGLALLYIFFLIKDMLDTKVKPDDDLTAIYDLPVYAEILDFETADKAGYKSRYSGYESGTYDEERVPESETTEKERHRI
jgi:capsular polysaccharide biosynthesis protein